MSNEIQYISKQELLEKANDIIKNHDDYIHGMFVDNVEQHSDVLVFKGEFFLDENGIPSFKSAAAFNMYKHLTHLFSEKYRLNDPE
ncbi:Protein of uncharacterised function (DUF2498) [Providencia rustigianii]|uniref:Protein YciN n=2 Tax=Providencia rustigianii TaxID=158850 RepID=D1NYM1_9GAMM|nr:MULTISPECIES: DUF2498 family protein [Providencia]EFB73569.1 hypothetical protein PROVRUST_04841 [Providencia rustigianii DSM 4541]MTC57559.1 DUF2498 family protein [Providencia rustigianii]MTC59071.1 DUF2498 family protein [Providencia rustigianii]SPY77653.1 Protein of uncharacterised function (DUF2498) [Providencia rustigianii]SUC35639.1 Protein of uncharacterised function (DUF2498) [Providencia rustigianii]